MAAGDRIIKLDKYKIDTLEDFDLALRRLSAGDAVEVTVTRGNQEVKTTVTLEPPK